MERDPRSSTLPGEDPPHGEHAPLRRSLPGPTTSAGVILFACLFAAQTSLLVLSPILSQVASDLGVSTAATGQLRAISGGVAGVVALLIMVFGHNKGVSGFLVAGLGLLALGALSSGIAPTFGTLVAAQLVVGVGLGLTLSAALAAAPRWVPGDEHTRVLSWALAGQPVAWVVGMPLIGALGDGNWRIAWSVPMVASVVALAGVVLHRHETVVRSPRHRLLVRHPGVGRWAVGELLAYAGWAGLLTYAGAMFTDAHGASSATAGLLLGLGAAAYIPGNFLARRYVDRAGRQALLVLAPVMAVITLLFAAAHLSLTFSLLIFALLAFLGGARTLVASALGLRVSGTEQLEGMGLRTAAVQFGYLLGATAGGAGLALAGWPGLGAALCLLLALAAFPHLRRTLEPA